VKDVFPILENIDENKPRGLCQWKWLVQMS
jgi:hypothetical protein